MPGQMFRQEALERLQSPDEFDQLLVAVDRKAWLILLTLVAVCAAGIAWTVFGRIPVTVDGYGVLVNPGNVKGVQSPASGQVTSVEVRIGQHVARGDVLARLDQPELRKELEQLRAKKDNLIATHKAAVAMDRRRQKLEVDSSERQRQYIVQQIAKLGQLSGMLDERNKTFVSEQRKNLNKTEQLTVQLNDSLTKRLKTLRELKLEGLSSQDLVLNAETSMTDSELRIANLGVQRQELEMRDIQREQSHLDNQNRLSDLALQLMQLDIAAQRLAQELTQNQQYRDNEMRDLENSISRGELRMDRESKVTSDCNGTVLEVAVQPGQVLGLGLRVATVEMDDPSGKLTNLSFFAVRDGKRITARDSARVTPSTVQREREGSIIGTVRHVSAFPVTEESVVNNVGNAEIARSLLQQGGAIEVEVDLERDPSSLIGYRWTSKGPDKKFSAGTTTTVRITIEQRAPITYLLPILRTWFKGEKDARTPTM
jgi:HlyD family secretion protein